MINNISQVITTSGTIISLKLIFIVILGGGAI